MPKQFISRVLSPVQRAAVIHLSPDLAVRVLQPYPFRLPAVTGIQRGPSQGGTYLALLQAGFTKLPRSPGTLVSSYLPETLKYGPRRGEHLFTLSPPSFNKMAGVVSLSVALSFPFPGLRITERLALWSSDFPPSKSIRSWTSNEISPYCGAGRPPVLLRQPINNLNYYIIFSLIMKG